MSDLHIDLSGLAVRLQDLPESIEQRLRQDWPRFVVEPGQAARIVLRIEEQDRAAPDEPFRPKAMRSSLGSESAGFELPEGCAQIGGDGRGRIELGRNLGFREYYVFLNLLRACLAWGLPRRGAALVHAAGLVVADRAYLLIGAEGSGKSTWARAGEAGGARVLSDDLVLVDCAPPKPEALGAPFRSTHRTDYEPGRWPIAAILFPEHGSPPGWWPAGELVSRARVAANLPFVADGLEHDPQIATIVDRLCTRIPRLQFRFGPDPSFLELLRREALPGAGE